MTTTGSAAEGQTLGAYRPHPHRAHNPHQEVKAGFGLQDRIALTITAAIGTMYAVYVFAIFSYERFKGLLVIRLKEVDGGSVAADATA